MCLAVPGKIISIDGTNAMVDVLGVKRTVAVDLLADINIGDYIMMHAGYAIGKVNEEEALLTLDLYRELGALMEGTDEHG